MITASLLPTIETAWKPTSIGLGKNCISWCPHSVSQITRNQGMAAQFTAANSEYLSIADNAALSMGDIDFTIETWAYMDTTPTSGNAMTFLGKWADPIFEYVVACLNEAGTITFAIEVRDTANTTTTVRRATTFGTPSTATWYQIISYHDAAGDLLGIQVNNGAADETSYADGVLDSTAAFQIGRVTSSSYMNGRIGVSRIWKRTLTAAEKTYLYNAGVGRAYDELDPTLRTSLIPCWELNEQSGTREDLHGSNNLTDNNTVTTNPGTILNAIGSMRDFGQYNNPAVQTTQANKPVIRQSSSTGRNVIKFDGVNDVLSLGDQTYLDALSSMSIFIVVKPTTVTTSGWVSKYNDTTSSARAWYFGSLSTGVAQFIVYDESANAAIGRNSATLQVVAGELAIFDGHWDGRLTTGITVFKNGLQIDATDNGVGLNFVAMENVATIGRIGSGGASGADAYFCDGEIAEVIVYNRKLNTDYSEAKKVERYLSRQVLVAIS